MESNRICCVLWNLAAHASNSCLPTAGVKPQISKQQTLPTWRKKSCISSLD